MKYLRNEGGLAGYQNGSSLEENVRDNATSKNTGCDKEKARRRSDANVEIGEP